MTSIVNALRRNEGVASATRLAGYAAITALAAVATFLTTPVLVRSLGLKGFGSYSLLDPLLVSTAAVILLGADHGVLKRIAYDHVDLRVAVGAALPFMIPLLILVGIVIACISPRLAAATIIPAALGILVPAEALLLFLTTAFRASNRLGAYAFAQGGRAVLILASVLFLSKVSRGATMSVGTVILVRLVVAGSLVVLSVLLVRPLLRIDWSAYRDGIQYGIFLVVTSALSAFQDNFDRYVIASASGRETVGGYVVCIKVAAIVGQSVILPLMIWFPAERLRHLKDEDGGERFFRTTSVIMLSLLLMVSGSVFLCGPQLVALIGPGTPYKPAVLLMLLAAGISTGMAHPLNIGLFKPGLSHYNMYPVAIAGAIGFFLARAWVAQGGVISVAAVKALSGLLALSMIYLLSQRAHAIRVDLVKLASLVAISGGLLTLLTSGAPSSLNLWIKVASFLATIIGVSAVFVGRSMRYSANVHGPISELQEAAAVPNCEL
ncbi:MAG TPA: hypothetical protein VHZ07_00735 [Bryobacteraceae bacterium]|jgi:O-antigen/teichoic acid export membrane protein|nr:hypothetical protein [Bryobacteraceae bacterium]